MTIQSTKYSLILLLIVISLYSCSKEQNSKNQEIKRLFFTVDNSLLASPYVDHDMGFSFSSPLGWEKMSQETIEKAREKLDQTSVPESDVKVTLHQFFFDKNTGASCVLSKLGGVSSDSLGMERLTLYNAATLKTFDQANVQQDVFIHKDFLVHQTLIMSDTTVNFKLIFPRSPDNSFQIDYIIPRKFYEEKLKVIESSIGSIISVE